MEVRAKLEAAAAAAVPPPQDAVCMEEFAGQEGKGLREPLLCTDQNGNLESEVGARSSVMSVLHAVIIEEETKEREKDVAKEEQAEDCYIGQGAGSPAPQSSALDSHQLNFVTICRNLPNYASNITPTPPIPEAELNQELVNQPKPQIPEEVYCLKVSEKGNVKKRSDAVFTAGSLKASSAALEDANNPQQSQGVGQNLSLGHAMRRSARCAAANFVGQQSSRASSLQTAKGKQDGAKEKKEPPKAPVETAPPPQKKTRTFYSAEQLEGLERTFHEDHYPDSEKRREIAAAIGVTPQRVMIWFQNRRAKWRKTEKLTVKGSKKCSVATLALSIGRQQTCQGITLLPAPPVSDMVRDQPSALMMDAQADANYSSMLSGSAVPLASSSVDSVTGRTTTYDSVQTKDISQGIFSSFEKEIFPAIPSPPPIRRASLPLNVVFNPNNHIVPLRLDTHSSEYSPSSQESSCSEVFAYSTQNQSIDAPVHRSYPEQLEPTANLETPYYHPNSQPGVYQFSQYPQHQVSQLQHGPLHRAGTALPSVGLTQAMPGKSTTAFFPLAGNGGLVTYGTAEASQGYLQNHAGGQLLIQPSAGNSGYIPAFQTVPWNELCMQGVPFSNQLCSQMQFSGSGGGCFSAEQAQHLQNQSGPPSPCLLQLPKAEGPGYAALLLPAEQMADLNSNLGHQSQTQHMALLEEDSDTDKVPKEEENISDFPEDSKN
ncbi:homeobox protein NOBOX [Lacerta agilis]|uniref:homeobox protein NOBOX n=1 Tax=Lacerta agilis TaxID=80427 RepID=UPI00141983A1|nr:homeobox protein NOBOX [Lacerta agilis]